MRQTKRVTVLASEARIASENSEFISTAGWDEMQVFLIVASKQGSPTSLDVSLEYSCDGGTTYAIPTFIEYLSADEAFTQVTGATSNQAMKLTNIGEGFRVKTTMAGNGVGKGWTFYVVAILKRLN